MRKILSLVLCLLCFVLLLSARSRQVVQIVDAQIEGQSNPQALHTATPRFSWKIASSEQGVLQQSWRILVASSEKNLKKGIADIWDSGEVESGISVLVPYGGEPLGSEVSGWWKVVVVTNKGVAESEPANFSTTLLKPGEITARWIGRDFAGDGLQQPNTCLPARHVRKEFSVDKKISRAKLYISGLGLYEAYVNGEEVGSDEYFKPTISDYDKRVYFNTYDVTKILRKGENCIGVELGTGRYTTPQLKLRNGRYRSTFTHYGTPCLIAQLEVVYADGTREVIGTDDSWSITDQGAIRNTNIFDGEIYDSRKELDGWSCAGYDDSSWMQAQLIKGPSGVLQPQPNPTIREMERARPVAMIEKDGRYILDMGQNMVGWMKIALDGQQAGDTLTMRFAELLNPDTTLYVANLGTAKQTDYYISKDSKKICWEPRFVYHGFRYVEVSGLRAKPELSDFEVKILYDQMATTGSFECSNEIMNKVYRNAYWGIRGNYHGMPTDCPQRSERMGWGGDRGIGAYGEAFMFDNRNLYAKWLTDYADSQRESGALSNIAPVTWKNYHDNITWPGTLITVADMLYQHFGDERPIELHYDVMKKWLVYMRNKYGKDGIIPQDAHGDWCMPPESLNLVHAKDPARKTDGAVISTAYYHFLLSKMMKFANIIGRTDDIAYFQAESDASREAFNREFFHENEGSYSNNTVTANLLGLFNGIAPEDRRQDIFRNIVDRTENEFGGHVSSGIIGVQQLMRTLTEYGNPELALKIASNKTYPSWGYMVENGATTIWELWNGNTANPSMNSGNHVMLLGDLIIWEYEYLGGIRALEPGFKKIELKPYPIEGLDYVNCSYDSPYGRILSNWKREGNHFEWEFTVPANTTARVQVPTAQGYRTEEYMSGSYRIESDL